MSFSTRLRTVAVAVAVTATAGGAVALSASAGSADDTQGGRPLTAVLAGANEVAVNAEGVVVRGVGDLDGSGSARVTFNPAKNLVCWDIKVAGIVEPLTGGHIHEAAAGSNGPIVVEFFGNTTALEGCITPRTGTTAREILANPAAYYVNIHSTAFRAGAIRGQLSK